MTLQIAEDLGLFLTMGGQPPDEAARELIVLELYRQHKISRGKAAQLLGDSMDDFLHRAGRLGIPYLDLSDAEIAREFESADLLSRAHSL